MKTLLNIAHKDFTVLMRDKAAVLVLVAMPLALIFILGSALGNLETGDFSIKTAIVNLDDGEVGEHFVEGLTETEDLKGLFEITLSDDADDIRRQVEQGDLVAALVIPADTSDKVGSGQPVTLEVLQDPGSPMAAGVWVGVVKAAVSYASADVVLGRAIGQELGAGGQQGAPAGSQPPAGQSGLQLNLSSVTVKDVEATMKKQVSMMSYYSAAMTAMFLLFGSMFGAFAFVKERREQTLARMLMSRANKAQIVGGKGLGILFIGLAQLVVLVVGTMLLFRVDWGTDLAAIFVIGAAEVVAATGLAMTLAALGKSERVIGAIGPAIIMLFAATGGSMMPAEVLPSWLKPAQVISPSYWALDGFIDVMEGASVADIAGRAGIVLVIAAVLYAFGVWRLSYE